MQTSRKKTRKFLLQKLYARIYGEVDTQIFKNSYYDGILDFDIDSDYLDEVFDIVIEKQGEILEIIHIFAPRFDTETMLKTNILAIGIALSEMLWYSEEIPAKVSINEAIELAKYFGDENQKKIVNGILNSAYENIETKNLKNLKIEKKYPFFSEK